MTTIGVPTAEDLPRGADLVVIGGGVVGVATAFWASRAGLSVVCLERREGLGTLTTAASEECFRAQFAEPGNIRMMMASIDFFERFEEHTGLQGYDLGMHQQGYLYISSAPDAPDTMRARVDLQRESGLTDVELLTGDEVRKRWPYLSPDVVSGTFRARDGWLSSDALTYGLARATTNSYFCLQTEGRSFIIDAKGVAGVQTNRGVVSTRRAVLATGPFARVWGDAFGIQLPIEAIRRHSCVITGHPEIPSTAPMTINDRTGVYWRPEAGGASLGWALPEPPTPPADRVPTDWTFPPVVLRAAGELTPFWRPIEANLKRENVFLHAGQYPSTPDENPIIDTWGSIPGLFLNVGYGGHGIMASPEGGRMCVELIMGRLPREDNPFRLDRFKGQKHKKERMVI